MTALAKTGQTALLQRLLKYEPHSGAITWTENRRGGAVAGALAGTDKAGGYRQIHVAGRLYYAHRLAWLLTHGDWPTGHVDHIDGNPANNAIQNLRVVTHATNQQNQRRAHVSNKSSGLLGVSHDQRTNRWLARISVNNRTKNLGRYATPELAHAAYLTAKRNLHEGNTL